MSEREFRHTTPRYFYFRSKGFESLIYDEWRRTRIESYHNRWGFWTKPPKRPEDLYYLPGDSIVTAATQAEIEHMVKVLKIAKTVDVFAGETMPKIIPEA